MKPQASIRHFLSFLANNGYRENLWIFFKTLHSKEPKKFKVGSFQRRIGVIDDLMGTKNHVMMLITHIDSVSIVHGNMSWVLASLRVFFCNYVLSSLMFILRYIFRFQVEDRKNEHHVQSVLYDQTKGSQFEDSEIDELAEKLINLLFPSSGEFYVADDEIENKTDCSVLMEATISDVPRESKSEAAEETETSVSYESEGEADSSAFKEKIPDIYEGYKESVGKTEGSISMETVPDVDGDVKKTYETETECPVSMEGDSNVHEEVRKTEKEEEETEEPFLMNSDSSTTISKYQFMSRKDISCFVEEPSTLTFSFRHFYSAPNVSTVSYDNAISSTRNIGNKEFPEAIVSREEEKESVQEQRTLTSSSYVDDYVLHNDDSLPSSSIGLTSGKSNNNHCEEEFETESLKMNRVDRVKEAEETQVSCDGNVSHGLVHEDTEKKDSYHEHEEETMREDNLYESDYEEDEEEDDLDWDDDDDDDDDELVQQMKLELRIAKQGGLATILEDEDDEEEETESPKVVGDLKPLSLKIDEKFEYKDQMLEIQKVYKSYAEKMRKLDILNYQTMNAIGLLQLKEPPKLILMPKSTVQGVMKPLKYENLWPRKAPKHNSDPMVKFVHELHRDLELVYVGHICLSWEILCWQHKKAMELQQFDSQWPRRYNLVAGEFQLFQVLIHRFLENEPFHHHGLRNRIHNYVKNRCVIRNLLHVPAIKDDNKKDKKIMKWSEEEDAISSGRLVEIIKESMHVFWDFVRADKDYGNVIPKVSKKIGNDEVDDPEISDLLVDIRAQLQKKERKLKEIVRSGSCIVRKFQKHHHEDQVQVKNHDQLLAQVGLRLVSRVINMKRLRKDQLLWCNEKLNRINFVGRKIQVEPSFLLFPC